MKSPHDPTDAPVVIPSKPAPTTPAEVWKPTETKHVERNQDGQLRTNAPIPPAPQYGWIPVVHIDDCED